MIPIQHHGKLSSFADPADVRSFNKWYKIYLDQGKSKEEAEDLAFAKGDNGEGCWGDNTQEGSGPSCAISPDDIIERGGSEAQKARIGKDKFSKAEIRFARNWKVQVFLGDKNVICFVKDKMPHKRFITNGAVVDLNPDAVRALGQEPPMLKQGYWIWLD